MQTKAWKAASSSASDTHVTDNMALAKGTYIVSVMAPLTSANMQIGVRIVNVGWLCWLNVPAGAWASGAWILVLDSDASIYAGTGSSVSCTYDNSSGLAKLRAVRIA